MDWNRISDSSKRRFRFQHISTDEVYGDLGGTSDFFTEEKATITAIGAPPIRKLGAAVD